MADMGWAPWSIAWYAMGMCFVATLNLAVTARATWTWSRSMGLHEHDTAEQQATDKYRRKMRVLSIPFVVVCAWRAYFPSIYLKRYCFIDSIFSNILAARLMSTVSELCLAWQITSAILRVESDLRRERAWRGGVNELGGEALAVPMLGGADESGLARPSSQCRGGCRSVGVRTAAVLFTAIIAFAEVNSCLGTSTTNSYFFMLEEGSWVVGGTLFLLPASISLAASLANLRAHLKIADPTRLPALRTVQRFVVGLVLFMVAYCPWGVISDVPSNYRRWHNDTTHNKTYPSVADGFANAAGHCEPTRGWGAWAPYLLWMTAYFSGLVWCSIALGYGPRIDPRPSSGGS